jgi:hypothetical protein
MLLAMFDDSGRYGVPLSDVGLQLIYDPGQVREDDASKATLLISSTVRTTEEHLTLQGAL